MDDPKDKLFEEAWKKCELKVVAGVIHCPCQDDEATAIVAEALAKGILVYPVVKKEAEKAGK